MNITGMLHGARLLRHVDFPTTEVLGPSATEDEIQGLIGPKAFVVANAQAAMPARAPVFSSLLGVAISFVAGTATPLFSGWEQRGSAAPVTRLAAARA